MKRIKHLIVSRVAIKWRYAETGLDWNSWVDNSFNLYNKFLRKSLENQNNQNFTLLTLVDKDINIQKTDLLLPNEKLIFVENLKMVDAINLYINTISNSFNYILLTRVDRDDCLHFDFVNNLQDNILNYINKSPFYFDLNYSYTYDGINNEIYSGDLYFNKISTFVSTLEKIKDGNIICFPYKFAHDNIIKHIDGIKLESLIALRVIHEFNLANKIKGDKIEYNLKKFGINEIIS